MFTQVSELEILLASANPRSVKSRKPHHVRSSVVAVTKDGVLIERIWDSRLRKHLPALEVTDASQRTLEWEVTDDNFRLYDFNQFHILFPLLPKDTIVIASDILWFAHYLHRLYQHGFARSAFTPMHGEFFFTVSDRQKEVAFNPSKRQRIFESTRAVNSMGFKRAEHCQNSKSHMYTPVSARYFFRNSPIRDYEWNLQSLMTVGQALANECSDIGVHTGHSPASIASRMLRLNSYYPRDRRRVPKATNEKARDALTGHSYDLKVTENYPHKTVTQFDQVRSHATVASEIDLPHANLLYARGDYQNQERHFSYGTKQYKRMFHQHGLFDVMMYNTKPDQPWLPLDYRQVGGFRGFVTSNEIPWLIEHGISIDSIFAAWTSPVVDTGIRAYASDGLRRIDNKGDNKLERETIKTIINAGIGILSAKPIKHKLLRTMPFRGSERFTMHHDIGELVLYRKAFKREHQTSIANLVQKTMIDRECRKRSFEFAEQLSKLQYQIVNIYADSVFAIAPEGQQSLFTVPQNWKIETEHTNIQFHTSTTWFSDQHEKMPGITLRERKRFKDRWSR